MFTKHIKIAQLLLLYCVVVQSYVVTENRSLTEDANSFQDLCDDSDEGNVTQGSKFVTHLYSFLCLSYKWSISHHSNTREGRSFNEHPLKDQSSVHVEKRDNRVEDRKIETADQIIEYVKSITMKLKRLQEAAKDDVSNSSQNLSLNTELTLLRFVIKVYQWTTDVMILNTIGASYYEKILELPERCIPLPSTNYTLEDRIVSSSDIVSNIKMIQNQLHEESEELYEKKKLRRMAEALVKNIESIVIELNKTLHSEKNEMSLGLNNKLCNFQLLAYRWVLNIRYPNIHKKSVNKNSQPPLEDQSSFPMEKNDNGPIDQEKNIADVLEHENRSTTTDASIKRVCERTIRRTLEMRLYVFLRITHELFYYQFFYHLTTREGRSLNDFQLPLDDQTSSLLMEESGLEDEEITIKDFMDNVKLTKRQLNENLKMFGETTLDTDNDFFQNLRNFENHKLVKRSNLNPIERQNVEYLRVKYILTIYRWISNMLIYNTLGKRTFDIFPHLRECRHTFPVENQLAEFEAMSNEIVYLTEQLQTTVD